MQNAQCTMQNGWSLRIVRFALCIVHFVVLLVVIFSSACSPSQDRAGSSTPSSTARTQRPSLRPVSLPDLTSAGEAAQAKIRERYESLLPKIGTTEVPALELAAAYGDLGKVLTAAEYFDAAEPCFLNAQTLQPTEVRWPYYLGQLARSRNEPAKAVPFFEQSLRLQPDDVPSLIWLGEMHLTQNRPDAAEPLFTKAVSLQPQSAAALSGLGRAALANKDYDRAATSLERALSLAPQASRLQYPLAMAYRGKGDERQTEAHLRRRGDVDVPLNDPLMAELTDLAQGASSYEVRGAEALEKRQWAEAVTNLRKAAELSPNNAFTRLNLGTALYLQGDPRSALVQFETALKLNPNLSKAHYAIGVIMRTNGRDAAAIEHFTAAVQADPGSVESRLQLGETLRASGHDAESLPHYAEVIKTSPSISQASFGYAMALVRLGRYREARDWLSDAMKTYPDQPGFPHALARILSAAPADGVRDGGHALSLMQQLLKQQKTVGLTETMAMTLAELGRFEEATTWQRETIAAANRSQPDAVPRLEQNLTLYENGKPCRTPWRNDDPVFHPRPQ
jgi:tetratricopeptide (TPR) repeat protein